MSALALHRQGAVVAAERDALACAIQERRGDVSVEGVAEEGRVRGLGLVAADLVGIFGRPRLDAEEATNRLTGVLDRVGGLADVVVRVATVVIPLEDQAVACWIVVYRSHSSRVARSGKDLETSDEDQGPVLVNGIVNDERGNDPLADKELEGRQAIMWLTEG